MVEVVVVVDVVELVDVVLGFVPDDDNWLFDLFHQCLKGIQRYFIGI